jgi:hypothetical protein
MQTFKMCFTIIKELQDSDYKTILDKLKEAAKSYFASSALINYVKGMKDDKK